jgi:cell division protein ZapA
MPQLTVTINSRNYRMACEDGQEEHLLALCDDLNRRIDELRRDVGEVGDTRLTVMAAIRAIDELGDRSERLAKLEQELATLRNARSAAADRTSASQAAIAETLNAAAERIDDLARRLNQSLGNGGDGVAIG